ncbi:MAG: hypothetical protein LLG40_10585 [Deltaproteobacteria bacterium]|nr:hypothetical protein [Deltaproteobacteria bacterium]
MNFFAKFYGFFSTRIEALKKVVDVRDVLILSGLSMLGYGLYLLYPWLSFTVCGALILAGGFFMKVD